jgi:ketosteroid isomerase-like protein
MRKRTLYLMFALLCLLPLAVQADKTADAKKVIQAIYDREVVAFKKKDMNGMLAANTPDYVYFRKNGQKTDIQDLKNSMSQVLAMGSNLKSSQKIVKFTLKGNKALAVTQGHLEMTITNPQNKQSARVVSDDTTEDIWQKIEGKWRRKQTRILKSAGTVNGKPVPQ